MTVGMEGLRPVCAHVGIDGIAHQLPSPTGRNAVARQSDRKEQEGIGSVGIAWRLFDAKLRRSRRMQT